MFVDEKLLLQKAEAYAVRHRLQLADRLGLGMHGIVFVAESKERVFKSAVKIFQNEEPYQKERNAYVRLKEHGVENIRGFHVPQLLSFDDDLLVVEVTIVTRPYLLDFAGAFLDRPPEFPEEVLTDWHEQKVEQFGERWAIVELVLAELRSHGIFFTDVNPDNVRFLDSG